MTAAANDLITLFLALELISIPTYVLLYLPRHDAPAAGSGGEVLPAQHLLVGVVLFGFSYLYGLTGTTNLAGDARRLCTRSAGDGPAAAAWRWSPW